MRCWRAARATIVFSSVHLPARPSCGLTSGHSDVPALCARRANLLAALSSALPAECIRTGREFERFEHLEHIKQKPSGVRVWFADGSSADHDALVGADGLRSRVRQQLFGRIEPVYRGYTVWRGVAQLRYKIRRGANIQEANSETWGRGQRFGILDTGDGHITWYATANVSRDHRDAPEGRREELLRLFRGWHDPIANLIAATDETAILKNGACDLPPLRRWGSGRVTLLGDAAHPCTPNLGQGGCMAIEDAAVLAKSLREEDSVEAALRAYEALRRRRTRHIQQRSLLMGRIGQWESDLMVAGRGMVTSLLPPWLFERNLRRVYAWQA